MHPARALMAWRRRLYPWLFAAFPIVGVAALNPGNELVSDVMTLVLIASIAVAILYLAVYAAVRFRLSAEGAADTAAFITFCAVAIFFSYGYLPAPLRHPVEFVTGNPRMGPVIVVAILGALLLVYHFRLHRRLQLASAGRFLTVTGALLVAWSVVKIGEQHIVSARAIRRSALVRDLARPVPVRDAGSGIISKPKHDIYIIILDEYASAAVLRERFGIDNRPLEDSLRTLGFRIPTAIRSNYANTLMSVSSFLNFAHMQPLVGAVDRKSLDFTPAAYLLEHNRTARFLKARGYRFEFFRSSWYTPTRHNSEADDQFDLDPGSLLARASRDIQRSEVLYTFASTTLFRKALQYLPTPEEVRTTDAARTFAGVADVALSKRPTFVFAHVLMPHGYYVEDARCEPLPRGTPALWRATPRARVMLAGELQCLNRQIIRTVRAVIAKSNPQPIIILQGDHGSQSLDPFGRYPEPPTTQQNRERFRPFGAYYLPDGGASAMPDSVSLVNVLRYVFSYYFDADLPPAPNTMYFSHWRHPYELTRVDSDFHSVMSSGPRLGRL